MDSYELPTDCIRELICNAVTHRSYLDEANIQVTLYDDRLEITSPGMLFGGLTIKDIKEGRSKSKNRGSAYAFAAMKIIKNGELVFIELSRVAKSSVYVNQSLSKWVWT